MSTFSDSIKITIDVINEKAKAGLRQFSTEIAKAETTTQKFQAGFKALGGWATLVGGTVAAFAVKSAHAFEQMSKNAIDASKATGLSVEQASRWIAVADDYQVSNDQLTTSFVKVAKTLNSGKWEGYGIATRNAGGEIRSTNEILLDAFQVLHETTNATERAAIGADLFGRGYAAIAPLVGKSRKEYEGLLAAVTGGQVITAEEAHKAEELRLAEDKLHDALRDLTVSFGGLISKGGPVIKFFTDATEKAASFVGLLTGGDTKSVSQPILDFQKAMGDASNSTAAGTAKILNAFQDLKNASGMARSSMDKTGKVISGFFGDLTFHKTSAHIEFDNIKKSLSELAAESPDDAQAVLTALNEVVVAAESGNKEAQKWTNDWSLSKDRINELSNAIGGIGVAVEKSIPPATVEFNRMGEAARNAASGVDELQQKTLDMQIQSSYLDAANALKGLAVTLSDTNNTWLDQQTAINGTQQTIVKYLDTLSGIPPEKVTEILALLDNGDVMKAAAVLEALAAPKTIKYRLEISATSMMGEAAREGLKLPSLAESIKESVDHALSAGSHSGAAAAAKDVGAEMARAAEEIAANMYASGAMSLADYKKFLQSRLKAYVKYSNDWMRIQNEIKALTKSDEEETRRNMYETGNLSLQDYKAFLQKRLAQYQKYSDDWRRIYDELKGLEDAANKDNSIAIPLNGAGAHVVMSAAEATAQAQAWQQANPGVPIIVNLQINDTTVQQFTIRQQQLAGGTR